MYQDEPNPDDPIYSEAEVDRMQENAVALGKRMALIATAVALETFAATIESQFLKSPQLATFTGEQMALMIRQAALHCAHHNRELSEQEDG